MDKLLRIFSALDWLVGGFSIVIGLYLQNGWVVAGGCLGLLAAYFKPALLIKAKLEKTILKKKPKTDDSAVALAEDAFYATMLGSQAVPAAQDQPAAQPAPVVPRTYRDSLPGYGGVFLSASKHNQLKQAHLRLLPSSDADTAEASPRYF